MQWIPDAIDAITRLYQAAGFGGLIVIVIGGAVVGLVAAVVLVLTRHTGQLVSLAQAYLTHQRENNQAQFAQLAELRAIKETNEVIAQAQVEIKSRVDKLPSDQPVCKAHTKEEIVAIISAALHVDPRLVELAIRQRDRNQEKEQPGGAQ